MKTLSKIRYRSITQQYTPATVLMHPSETSDVGIIDSEWVWSKMSEKKFTGMFNSCSSMLSYRIMVFIFRFTYCNLDSGFCFMCFVGASIVYTTLSCKVSVVTCNSIFTPASISGLVSVIHARQWQVVKIKSIAQFLYNLSICSEYVVCSKKNDESWLTITPPNINDDSYLGFHSNSYLILFVKGHERIVSSWKCVFLVNCQHILNFFVYRMIIER